MIKFKDFLINSNSSIKDAISRIETNDRGIVYVQNLKDKKL